MGIEEEDESIYEEVKEMNDSFLEEYEQLHVATMLDGEYDRNNAIVTLHAGTGGTEACDWTNMLFRMYTKWAAKAGFEVEILDMLDGDEAGLKSVTIQVNGENAYGYLKSEKASIVWCVYLLSTAPADVIRLSLPAMLCRKSKTTMRSKSRLTTSVSTHIVPAAPAVSMSTKHLPPSVSLTSPQGLWYSVRMKEASSPTKSVLSKC